MPKTLDALKQVAEELVLEMNPQQVPKTPHGHAALARQPRTATYDTCDMAMSEVPLAVLEEAIERVAPEMNSQGVAKSILCLHKPLRDSDFSGEPLCTECRDESFVLSF